MLLETKEILQETLEYINAVNTGKPKEMIEVHSIKLKESFVLLDSRNETRKFYIDIQKEFQDNDELQILLLSVFYKITLEESILIEVINILKKEKIDLFTSLMIRSQVEILAFRNTTKHLDYRLRRELHKSLLLRLEKKLGIQLEYKPLNTRNNNRIVIVTNQLIGDLHAPTNITKEICYVLQEKLAMEVLLIVCVEEMESQRMEQVWFEPNYLNCIHEYNGNFVTMRYDKKIYGYQIVMGKNNLNELKQLVEEVYYYNPLCIWYMGSITLFADLFRNYTTVLGMPFTDGYAISEAMIMVDYLNSQSESIKKMEEYLEKSGQIPLNYNIAMPLQHSSIEYKREDYGFNENDFLITIIGNRLDYEITEEFLLFLKKVINLDSRIIIVFIGEYKNYSDLIKEQVFMNRTKYLGYQEDLIGIVSIMDLFLNPPRKGGGGGAIYCLYNGVPVVTLASCDVATCIDREDVCATKQEMFEQIQRYLTDSSFYDYQSKKALKTQKNYSGAKLFEDTKMLFENITKIIYQQEEYLLIN